MDRPINQFIRDANIANYIERLHTEEDGATRGTLQRLLIEEEDAFGQVSEKIGRLDNLIVECEQRANKVMNLIVMNGASPLAEKLLQNANDLVFILKTLRIQAVRQADKSAI